MADVESLNKLIAESLILLEGIKASLQAIVDANGTDTSNPLTAASPSIAESIDCLALARDSAKLARAHATKISLFVINEPFTPSVISQSVRDLAHGAVPALATAVQQCDEKRYTKQIRRNLAWLCIKVVQQAKDLLKKVPQDGRVLKDTQFAGLSKEAAEKMTIQSTGLLWKVCDEVVDMANLGVAGCLVKSAEQYRAALLDVLEELKEWKDDIGDAEDDEQVSPVAPNGHTSDVDDLTTDMNNTHVSNQAMIDDIMLANVNIPPGDPDKIRERLDSTIRRLRLTTLLYQAIIKRRLKHLPPLPLPPGSESNVVTRLDEVMPLVGTMSGVFDNVAIAFYHLDSAEITKQTDQAFFDAFAISELFAKAWDGERDEFAAWVAKYQIEIRRV